MFDLVEEEISHFNCENNTQSINREIAKTQFTKVLKDQYKNINEKRNHISIIIKLSVFICFKVGISLQVSPNPLF